MKPDKVIEYFSAHYPGKSVISLPEIDPQEIICEIEPTSEHSEYSVAIAAVRHSAAHYHKNSTEIYELMDGVAEVALDGKIHMLSSGQPLVIEPGQVHECIGDFSLIKVTSHPGWTPEDHFIV